MKWFAAFMIFTINCMCGATNVFVDVPKQVLPQIKSELTGLLAQIMSPASPVEKKATVYANRLERRLAGETEKNVSAICDRLLLLHVECLKQIAIEEFETQKKLESFLKQYAEVSEFREFVKQEELTFKREFINKKNRFKLFKRKKIKDFIYAKEKYGHLQLKHKNSYR